MIQFLSASQVGLFVAFNVAVCFVTVSVNVIGRARRFARIVAEG